MMDKNRLEDIKFIGGGSQFFEYEVFDRNGEALDLVGCEITFTLSMIGQNESPIVVKDNKTIGGVTVKANVFTVELLPADTIYLYNSKYEQQPIIKQPNGKILRPSYGYFEIRKGTEY